MVQKPNRPPASKPRRTVTATRKSKRLMIQRLREIDRLSRKELDNLMNDTERLKRTLHGSN